MGLFSWFHSKPECPVDAETRKWIDHRWRWLEATFGPDRVRSAAVILPRPAYFPEPYNATEAGARRMLDQVCRYMGVDPATVLMSLYDESDPLTENPGFGGQMRQGTAGLYHAEGGRYRIWIEAANLHDPLAMVATMAHELGHVHLLGHGRVSPSAQDHEPLTDLLTVFLGLGVFTANSVIREQYWHEGHSSGWSIGRRGYLTMPMYGYAFALFARTRGENGAVWSRELRSDVRTAFQQATRFLTAETSAASVPGRSPAVDPVAVSQPPVAGTRDGGCPHCGAGLTPVRDAFCPECREPLDP